MTSSKEDTTNQAFKLSIQLGNAAMSEPEHVAEALLSISQAIEDGERDGNIFDGNGNHVGRWAFPFS